MYESPFEGPGTPAAAVALDDDEAPISVGGQTCTVGAGVVLGVDPLDWTFGGKWGAVANCLSLRPPLLPLTDPSERVLMASTCMSSSSSSSW